VAVSDAGRRVLRPSDSIAAVLAVTITAWAA
jgi:hypothetical protein